ncbi:MAG: aromatic ring-hydroxylating dioxygenase subunit alpha [Pelagibacteraceae bacterium]|nr:aromatic ring-hydroxylating dioxygenase subunit alpha [Pelagibacteraceae bacterium]MDP6784657.1 aromatic ring-hydroxylating dioxygenase subunit alpha [Alphaproteobacteria bacterium]MBO6467457.1 aromatic ring-hydroxylating dioxygenase subunit alpha [Pelagibacteraceae bacterium]MBO6468994.1 aromatic ring-hydroxylating dioxygenase subunit alpha [Pelagibacteraceae bacterium]MBO6470511.1 aromatic ring-hydroxylating dioxygenase subunit alpha [Pelagibacteraceae bacterium]
MNNIQIKDLIKHQKINHSLDRPFYVNDKIFDLDIKNIFSKQWVFVGHTSRIPNIGDYFLFDIGNESMIIIRDKENIIHAHYNVCRHRGSHICLETEGNKKLLLCPYHAWSFNLDGTIKSARLMEEDFNKDEWSLHKCNLKVFEGLIFINLSENPCDFEEFIEPTRKYIEFHELGKAKIAFRKIYPTDGNWKLALDNFHECYHCQPSHPEYCSVHDPEYILSYGAGSGTGPASEKFNKILNEWNEKVKKLGHLTGEYAEKEFNKYSRSAERTPLKKGKFTETKKGKPIAKLMGKFKEYDRGYTSVGTSPFNSLLMCNDFATLFTFIPKSTLQTDVELIWLVHKDAKEGKDYDLSEMIWMWDETTKADKRIIEDNQKGVLSSKYMPGPLSQMEKGLEKFKSWYLKHLELALD